jgi:hypothetical protein
VQECGDVGTQRRLTRRERAVEVEYEELLDGVPPGRAPRRAIGVDVVIDLATP